VLTTTMQAVIKETVNVEETRDHLLYLIRDEAIVWYIGQAIDPIQRLQTHLGMDWRTKSQLGYAFQRHLPAALEWKVGLYTLVDCESLVKCYILPRFAPYYTLALYYDQARLPGAVTFAEQALIEHYHPQLNVRMSTSTTPALEECTHPTNGSSTYLQ
jgi:hypothetical protein